MIKKKKPPTWKDLLSVELLKKALDSAELEHILDKAQKEYVYWDKFRHYNFPSNLSAEEAWAYLKFSSRQLKEITPIKCVNGKNFRYDFTKTLFEKLNYIDTHGGGLLKTIAVNPSEAHASKFFMSSLTEEAIASSQIEGANTTRKIAKEMLITKRAPRNTSERMILNNYKAMQLADGWKDLDLSLSMLLEIQKVLMEGLEDGDKVGRFRVDSDDIVVHNPVTGDVVHVPPQHETMLQELDRLIKFANKKEDESDFIHPVIKATILHFWLAYIHPFTDGNGRSARIIFYWYLLKQNYWIVKYISVSRAIKTSRKKYDEAYLNTEYDDNDFTYFLLYIVDSFKNSLIQFYEYFERKTLELENIRKTQQTLLTQYNTRQIELLQKINASKLESIDVQTYQNMFVTSRATANNDLRYLVNKGFLSEKKVSKKILYLPKYNNIKKIIK